MKNVWKLSNYLYGWLWQKWTKVVTLVSMILAVCFLIAAAMPTGDPKAYDYYPKVFRSYDMVIDHSLLPILFALGLLLILIGIFVQIKGFSTNGKGIYTMLLLPMKRHEVYFAFVLSAAAAVALYYLLWLVLMVAAYFPLMSFYKMQAAKEIFVLTRDNIVTGLDVSRTNGLFLAFHRSTFLDMVFPSSVWRVVPALGGFALIFTGIFFAGFCTENKVTAVLGSSAMQSGCRIPSCRSSASEPIYKEGCNMKKRNRVLEAILCAALAVVVFWGYMFAAKDNGVFALEDIEGDRTALNAFAFEGLAGDDNGQIYYIWQNGELKTKYYAATNDEMRYIIRQERDGSKGISRYFKKRSLARSEYFSDTEFAPSKDANVRRLSGLEDLSESAREYLGEYFDGDTVQGVTADALDVYGKVKNYTGGETRFFTGLQLKGGEYQAAKVKEGDTTYQSSWFDGRNEVILCTVKMDDAWYAIPQTGADGQGEVSIFRIPKDGMADIPYSGEDALYSTKQYGKAESLQTFSVNAENRILSLEKAGDNQLLLARTEQDALILELYDTEGKLLDRLETGVQKVSEYNIDFVNMLQRADGLVLWLNLSKTFQEDEDGTVHQRVEGTKCFVVQEKAIAQIAIDGSAEYVDVQDGKVLKLYGTKPEHIAADYFGYMMDGYEITVTDAKTNELLYRGKLKTDFVEDYNGELYAINIGQREKPLTERRDEESWIRYSSIGVKKRYFKMLLPVDGTAKQTSWVVGQEVESFEVDF